MQEVYSSEKKHQKNYRIINYNLSNENRCINLDVFATESELEHLCYFGFLKRDSMFSEKDVKILAKEVDLLVDKEMQMTNREYYQGNGIFIRYLMSKNITFQFLLTFEPIISIAKAMLGPQVQIMDLVARVTFLDEINQKLMWHIHNRVVPNPTPPFFAYPHGLDVLIYLDDADEENGALCVIPKSHLNTHLDIPFMNHSYQNNQTIIPAKAGDCIFSHSNLWHRVIASKSSSINGRRRVLLLGFMPSWFKKEFPKGIKPDIDLLEPLRESGTPEIKELLGYFEWV